jgi:hypothetical protein
MNKHMYVMALIAVAVIGLTVEVIKLRKELKSKKLEAK